MSNLIPTVSKKTFASFLKERGVEDPSFIKNAEDFLIKKRGFVYKQPQEGDKVILLISGGIDSTVAWAVLMKIFNFQVYPLFTDRGLGKRPKRELRAVKFFEKYFAQRFPKNFVKPFHLEVNVIPKQAKNLLDKNHLLPQDILNNYQENKNLVEDGSNVVIKRANGISPYILPLYGVYYAKYLRFTKGLDIKNIFVGVNASDGFEVSSQSFTALRSTLLSMCTATADWSWNFSSVFMEKERQVLFSKEDTIALGAKLNIPLEKCWSCYQDHFLQCGDACLTCVDRKRAFLKAGVEDKTLYLSDLKDKIRLKIEHYLNLFKKYFLRKKL